MGRRRGEIEEWLKRVFFGRNRNNYIVYIRFRVGNSEEYRPIPAELIDDVRGGYIVIGEDKIPYHRVVEIRDRKGNIVYSRLEKKG
ncbi:MAG: RNA repair domain-containing protein [Thermoprotei archaeon]